MASFNTVCMFLLLGWAGFWWTHGKTIKSAAKKAATSDAAKKAGGQLGGALLNQALKKINGG
jgi:hypothetical protein